MIISALAIKELFFTYTLFCLHQSPLPISALQTSLLILLMFWKWNMYLRIQFRLWGFKSVFISCCSSWWCKQKIIITPQKSAQYLTCYRRHHALHFLPPKKNNLELKLPKKLLKNIYNIIFVNQCITMFLKVLPCGRLLWSNENNVDVEV